MNCPKKGNPAGMRGLSEAPSPSCWASTSIREPSRPSASKYVSSVSSPLRPANIMPYFPVSAVESSSLRWGATTHLCILIANLLSDILTYYGEVYRIKKERTPLILPVCHLKKLAGHLAFAHSSA